MTTTAAHRVFAPIRRVLPSWLSNSLRSVGTVVIGPARFAYRTGYALSAFKMAAVSRDGKPLPWYSYPAIDFLRYRDYEDRVVLEFGGGQSTLWWAERARHVVTFEGSKRWHDKLSEEIPANVSLFHVSMESEEACIADVRRSLAGLEYDKYDVVVIDGLCRDKLAPISVDRVSEDGMIVCDNAEGYGIQEAFSDSGLNRVDFFGNSPGVVLPHATSIYFGSSAFVFDPKRPIPAIAYE